MFFFCSFLLQELIPVILCSAIHHPEAKERDNLLHMLFNLIKRPDEDQRWGLKIMIMITNRQLHLRYKIYITVVSHQSSSYRGSTVT